MVVLYISLSAEFLYTGARPYTISAFWLCPTVCQANILLS